MSDKLNIRVVFDKEFQPKSIPSRYVRDYVKNRWIVVCEHPMLDMRFRFACKPTRKQIRECIRVTYEAWHEIKEEQIRYIIADEAGEIL